jgi:methylthioribulose-1-phosphate dehydratase
LASTPENGRVASAGFEDLARRIAELGRFAHGRGWVLGTSGNFSAVVGREPLRLAITASGADKGRLGPAQVLEIDGDGRAVGGDGRPSAETSLHLAVVRARGAGAVLHTHSPWSTLLSDIHAGAGGLAIEGYEMLKGLEGVTTHQHREWLPVVENSQDWGRASAGIEAMLKGRPEGHGFLIRRHGLYTWGRDLGEAARHLEVLEFLLEVVGRSGEKGGSQWRA